jgi:hypothetical protein
MTGPTALLPLRRKSCYGFFIAIKNHRARPGLNPRTLSPMASTLPLDHRGRLYGYTYIDSFIFIYRLYNLIFSVAMTNDLHKSSKVTRVSVERFRALCSKLLSPVWHNSQLAQLKLQSELQSRPRKIQVRPVCAVVLEALERGLTLWFNIVCRGTMFVKLFGAADPLTSFPDFANPLISQFSDTTIPLPKLSNEFWLNIM